jgi:ADP-ribosylglycohydrolase
MNKIWGMLDGVALGDALGAPHERYDGYHYTGRLEFEIVKKLPFGRSKIYPVASVTDDTLMTMALLKVVHRGYSVAKAISAYQAFAKTCPFIGKNTKALFGTGKTPEMYFKKYHSHFETDKGDQKRQETQPNGALMRCSPLAICFDRDHIESDCYLTNPNNVSYECNIVYLTALRQLLEGAMPEWDELFGLATEEDVIAALTDASNDEERDLSKKKGWCCTAFYCAMRVLGWIMNEEITTFDEGIRWMMINNTDTDTNAAVVGALLGASLGYREISRQQSQNLDLIYNSGTAAGFWDEE